MKKLLVLSLLVMCSLVSAADSVFTDFVKTSGDKLVDENGPLRFISYNIPCLHYNEDVMQFNETNAWSLPDEFEISDALEAVAQMGGQVVRIYTLSVRSAQDSPDVPRHVLAPGKFNEEAFQTLDKVLQIANQKGVRVIIPLVDNWKWWGGVAEYAAFRGKKMQDFWTDEQLLTDFKMTIDYVLNRTNTYTGVKYKDDPAILAWESGNELESPHTWTAKIAAYLQKADTNHLVIDGRHTRVLHEECIADENVDIVTTHHYSLIAAETISQIKKNAAMTKGRKPYFVGEYGFLDTSDMQKITDTIMNNENVAGGLIWSLRFRNRNGGFYWHSEPLGGDKYKAYHWPGFESSNDYDGTALIQAMTQKAYAIQSKDVPLLKIPAAPKLLPIDSPAHISWQGSAGAQSYMIERAESAQGPWQVIADNVSDAAVQYMPLFNDENVTRGQNLYYRVTAQNTSGKSLPSNIVGPVKVYAKTLVDDMMDFKQIHKKIGDLSLEINQSRKYKEDGHRLRGSKNDYIVYQLPDVINSWQVYAFFPDRINDLEFYLSADGDKFEKAACDSQQFFSGAGDYGYAKPVLYNGYAMVANARYLKIAYNVPTHIGRVEINYAAHPQISHTDSTVGFIKAFSWGWTGWRGQYTGDKPVDSVKKMAQTGADWMCLAFGTEMKTFDDPHLPFAENNPRMVTDGEVRRACQLARDNNMKIVFKPVVNVQDTTWRAWIKFNDEDGNKKLDDWKQWWGDFEAFLLYYARMAEEMHAEVFCLGCEMESTEEFETQWRTVIAKIRMIYSGVLTYNGNHGREAMLGWWDAVDVISISAYYPVGTDEATQEIMDDLRTVPAEDTTLAKMKKRWLPIKEDLREVSKKFNKPVFFIELGLCSAYGASAAPWTHYQPTMIYDGDEQARYYQAAIETFWNEPWFVGFAWWDWPPQLYPVEKAQGHTGFSIYGKPAEQVVRQWYSKPR